MLGILTLLLTHSVNSDEFRFCREGKLTISEVISSLTGPEKDDSRNHAPPGWPSDERVGLMTLSSMPGSGDFPFWRIFFSHLCRSM